MLKKRPRGVTSYTDVKDWAAKFDQSLTAMAFGRAVHVAHDDGTSLFYVDAFAAEVKEWIVVFTEHYGYHIFDKTDVAIREYLRVYK